MQVAKLLLIGLIALGSQACAAQGVQTIARCPAPVKPDLPLFDPELPFDHLSNVENLLKRDDYMRQYVRGLEDAVHCYEHQIRI